MTVQKDPLTCFSEKDLKTIFQTKAWPHLFKERPLPSPHVKLTSLLKKGWSFFS